MCVCARAFLVLLWYSPVICQHGWRRELFSCTFLCSRLPVTQYPYNGSPIPKSTYTYFMGHRPPGPRVPTTTLELTRQGYESIAVTAEEKKEREIPLLLQKNVQITRGSLALLFLRDPFSGISYVFYGALARTAWRVSGRCDLHELNE